MKKIATFSLSFAVMAVTLFAFFSAYPKAHAEEISTIASEAVVLNSCTYKNITWTNENCQKVSYSTFSLNSKGYIVLTASKPVLANNEYGAYIITLYNEDGDVVWKADTSSQINTTSKSYSYTIGLDKGTYYMGIEAKFLVEQGSVSARYRFVDYPSNYWEIEGNDSADNATDIVLNSTYSGVFCEQSDDTSRSDYYAISLEKGYNYRIRLTNYATLINEDAGMLFRIVSPSGKETIFAKEKGIVSGAVTYWEFTALETGTYYLKLSDSGNKIACTYKLSVVPFDVSANAVNVTLLKDTFPCSGDEIRPVILATYGDFQLEEGVQYTAKYPTSAVDVGTYNIALTFQNGYSAQKLVTFKIIPPIDVSELDVSLSNSVFEYDGTAKLPDVIAKYGDEILVKDVHYTVTYPESVNSGDYTATVTFKKGYTGTVTLDYTVLPPIDASTLDVNLSTTLYTYDGNEKTPDVVAKDGNTTLKKDTHYTVTYPSACINPGDYTVTVAFKGRYTGKRLLNYKIDPVDVSALSVNLSTTSYTYDGTEKAPSVIAKHGDTILKKDTHYTVKYSGTRINPGSHDVTVDFKGFYKGTKKLSFEIVSAPESTSKISFTSTTNSIKLTWPKVEGATGYMVYQYSPSRGKYVLVANVKGSRNNKNDFHKPGIPPKKNDNLTSDVTYQKNKNLKPGTTYKFKVVAYQMHFYGKKSKVLSTEEILTATKCVAPKITSAVPTDKTIRLNWTKVEGATGYKVYQYSPSKHKYVEVASVKDTTYQKTKNFKSGSAYKFMVAAYQELANGTIVIGTASKPFDASTKCAAPKIIKIETTKNTITLTWNKVEGATGYKVFQYSPGKGKYVLIATVKETSYKKAKNLKPGMTYKFKVMAYTELSEEKTLEGVTTKEFKATTKCTPPKIKNYKPSAGQKVTIKWSAVAGATGYQVYYSTNNSDYKKAFSTTSEAGTKIFTPSAKGKTIYFKVRAYTKVDGKTVYGEWSEVKSLVIK